MGYLTYDGATQAQLRNVTTAKNNQRQDDLKPVRLDGTWVDDSYERVRLKEVERAIEQRFGLQDCTPRPRGERIRASIREGKLREQGTVLGKDVLRGVLEELVGEGLTLPLLMVRVKAQGYGMRFHEFADGKGVSFGVEEQFFQGRQLGDKFTFGGLQEFAGVDYQAERDDPVLRQLNGLSAEDCRAIVEESEQALLDSGQEQAGLQQVEWAQSQVWQQWVLQQEQMQNQEERQREKKRQQQVGDQRKQVPQSGRSAQASPDLEY